MRFWLLLILAGSLALSAGVFTRQWLMMSSAASIKEPLLVDLEGKAHTLAEWKGRVVVLNFWATWCPPCREEMPDFTQIQSEFDRQGVSFIGIAIDDPLVVKAYLAEHPVNYPILVGGSDVPAWADRLGNEISALPFSVVLDRKGQQIHAHIGRFHHQQILDQVKPLLLP
ncbi:MAG: TlpA family protein disulfide reductase [Methylococcus sp.]|jgi:thiol-disulfide isomerase/thioredoxin|nr:MAG: TlpA family protein disulfide reductase [Methylococcus sp.]